MSWRQNKNNNSNTKNFCKKTETYDIDTLRATTIIFYNGSKS